MARPPVHGMSNTPTWESWMGMRWRCSHRGARSKYYLDKGIRVCKRWGSFENFLMDMGERPEGTSLERVDGSKNYTPENCVWATPKAQALNRTSTKFITFKGVTLCKSDWARKLGIRPYALSLRIRLYGVQRALTMPRGATGPKPSVKW